MATAEIRIQAEGELWWVQASGKGTTWATASAPASGELGFCQSFSYASAANIVTVNDRGTPDHHKMTMKNPIDVTFQCYYTANIPTAVSGSGATVPMMNLEYRVSAAEAGPGGAQWFQFMGMPFESWKFTENQDGNTLDMTTKALAMTGPTASGYLRA